MQTKREEPRVAFASLIEAGLVTPGEALHTPDGRRQALVRADGAIHLGPAVGSIHKIGALAQGLPACNGWTYWRIERAGKLVPIDDLRSSVRARAAHGRRVGQAPRRFGAGKSSARRKNTSPSLSRVSSHTKFRSG